MATEYMIRCSEPVAPHPPVRMTSWPDSARRYQVPALFAIVAHRDLILRVEDPARWPDCTSGSVYFDPVGYPGDFLRAHRGCHLVVVNEYGEAVDQLGAPLWQQSRDHRPQEARSADS